MKKMIVNEVDKNGSRRWVSINEISLNEEDECG